MANQLYEETFFDAAIRAETSRTLINKKINVCPFAVRLAWHTSGTIDINDKSEQCGGSNGATMRFEPEISDPANAGLAFMQDIIRPVRDKFPNLSYADLWTMAGTQAIALMGGPKIPFQYGRVDHPDNTTCPPLGRLPDASQGAQHLRDIFYRMGFTDQDIVALSGAHTLGSCHRLRSGFDGPWTHNPLRFDNEYYKNLLELEWTPRVWDGPLQYTDPSGKLMMLPTDIALIQDENFIPYVKAYAADEQLFFKDFARAFGALLSKGCPAHCQPIEEDYSGTAPTQPATTQSPEKDLRDLAMHGSLERIKDLIATAGSIDINSMEPYSNRTALHKSSFFGHAHVVDYLVVEMKAMVDVQDADGDTPLHDAARFGHLAIVDILLKAGADQHIQNREGKVAIDLAMANEKSAVVEELNRGIKRKEQP